MTNPFSALFERFQAYREKLNLPCPGPYENLHREVKGVLPTLHLIDGAKVEATSILSPSLHVTHSMTWGSQMFPPMYHFGVGYQFDRYMLSGQVDHEGSLQARGHYQWLEQPKPPTPAPPPPPGTPMTPAEMQEHQEKQIAHQQAMMAMLSPLKPSSKTKVEAQLSNSAGHTMVSIEHELVGKDFSLSLRAINPNPIDAPSSFAVEDAKAKAAAAGPTLRNPNPRAVRLPPSSVTGIYYMSYMQSISKSLALGGEFVYQRPTPEIEEPAYTLTMRYAPPASGEKIGLPPNFPTGMPSPYPPFDPNSPPAIFGGSFSPSTGMLHTSYWRRINQRLEVAAELQTLTSLTNAKTGAPGRREGIASVGFKMQTVFALVRGMIDTQGRVSAVSDYQLAPGLNFQISGEMDYSKGGGGQGKVGLGFQIEA